MTPDLSTPDWFDVGKIAVGMLVAGLLWFIRKDYKGLLEDISKIEMISTSHETPITDLKKDMAFNTARIDDVSMRAESVARGMHDLRQVAIFREEVERKNDALEIKMERRIVDSEIRTNSAVNEVKREIATLGVKIDGNYKSMMEAIGRNRSGDK